MPFLERDDLKFLETLMYGPFKQYIMGKVKKMKDLQYSVDNLQSSKEF